MQEGIAMKKLILLTIVILLAILPHPALSQGWNVEQLSSCLNLWDGAFAVDVSGNYAYVASGYTGLRIMDVSNPTLPFEIGYYTLPDSGTWRNSAYNIKFSGNYAYVASWIGLHIFDVTDPVNPNFIKFIEVDWWRNFCFCISGKYVYVPNWYQGAKIIDVSDPANPLFVEYLNSHDRVYDIAIQDSLVYLAIGSGLAIFDISNPQQPSEIAYLYSQISATLISISGNFVYTASELGELYIIDISDPTAPELIGSLEAQESISKIAAYGDYLFIAEYDGRVRIINISNPENPFEAGTWTTLDYTYDIQINNNLAYIADTRGGLHICNVSEPLNIQEIGRFDTQGYCLDVVVSGNYAYTTSSNSIYPFSAYQAEPEAGLRVIDISDIDNPHEIASNYFFGTTNDIAICDHYVYISYYDFDLQTAGLKTLNVSDPFNPTEVGCYQSPDSCPSGFAISGDYAYLVHPDEIQIINIADPTNLFQVSRIDGYTMGEISVCEGYLYFLDETSNSIKIYNISNPNNPFETNTILPNPTLFRGDVLDLEVSGDYLYVTTYYEYGLTTCDISFMYIFNIIDIRNQSNPVTLAFYEFDDYASKIYLSGDHVILSKSDCGFQILNISDPCQPYEVGYSNTPGFIHNVAVRDSLIYAANLFFFSILDFSQALQLPPPPKIPTTYNLLPAYPNPFNPSTTIGFTLSSTDRVSINIYDVTGRHITTLFDGTKNTGTHNIIFNGTNLSSGVYFVNFQARHVNQTRKIVLIK